jgi:hypothetical protein
VLWVRAKKQYGNQTGEKPFQQMDEHGLRIASTPANFTKSKWSKVQVFSVYKMKAIV